MPLNIINLVLALLANLVIGVYVYRKGPLKKTNRSFSLFIATIVIWNYFTLVLNLSEEPGRVAMLGHACFASGVLIPVAFLKFSLVFPYGISGIKRANRAVYIFAAAMFLLSWTSLIQREVVFSGGAFIPRVGVLYPLYALFHMAGSGLGLFYLYGKWRAPGGGREAVQLKILFSGILISGLLILAVSVILPTFDVSHFVSLGPLFSVIIVAFTSYAIFRHRFLDISFVVKKTIVYAIVTGAVTGVYIVFVLAEERFLREVIEYRTLLPAFSAAVVIALFFLPLWQAMQRFVDRKFFRSKNEYRKILRDTSDRLTRVLSLPKLCDVILEGVGEAFGTEKASIWLEDGGRFNLTAGAGLNGREKSLEIERESPLALWMARKAAVAFREEIARDGGSGGEDTMSLLGAEAAIPVFGRRGIAGIIFIGEKKYGGVYTREDEDLLMTLASQASVAMENARLYTQLEEEKRYLDDILNRLPCGVVTTDSPGRVCLFNRQAAAVTGISGPARGRAIEELFPASVSAPLMGVLKKGGGFFNREMEYRRADGSRVPLALSAASLSRGRDDDYGIVVVMVDISEIKKLESELRRSEKLASLGTVATTMAHEIKNPLVAINTFMELLPQRYEDEQFRNEFSRTAAREVARINDIIQRLLNLSRPKFANPVKISLHGTIDRTLSLLESVLRKNSVAVERRYDGRIDNIYADENSIKDVFLNIFLNSIESMEGGTGKLEINTSLERAKGGSNTGSGEEAVVEVRDSGRGIPPEILPEIFEPFFSNKTRGTGLGLFSVRQAMKEHGGSVKVRQSGPGRGACMELRFPAGKKQAQHFTRPVKADGGYG